MSAQYFDITKVIFDNVVFDNVDIQNYYTKNLKLENKEIFLEKIILQIEKEKGNDRISPRDECSYSIFNALNYTIKNNNNDAIKYTVKAKRIAEKLNDEPLMNASAILASVVYRKMDANSLVVTELNSCKNLKNHEQYQVLLSIIEYQELSKDYTGVKATIEKLDLVAKKTSNYDYLYFSKRCFYFYLETIKDYTAALKYSFLSEQILNNFTTGDVFCADIYYNSKRDIDENYIIFERIFYLSNRGTAYRFLNKLTESENSLLQAIEWSKKYKAEKKLAFLYNNFGLTYTILKKYDKAAVYYQLGLNENIARKNNTAISENYNLIAKNELLRNQQQASSKACQQSIKIAEQYSDYKNLAASYFILSEIYQLNNDYLNAQKNYKLFSYYSDLNEKSKVEKQEKEIKTNSEVLISISSIERDFTETEKNELELLRIKLESEQRSQELLLLKKENELKEKTLLNQQLEKEQALKSLTLIRQQLEKEKLLKEYDRINKDREIKGLENDKNKNQIKLLYSQKTISEKENILKNLQIKRDEEQKKYLIIGLIFLGLIFLFFAFLLFRNNRQRKIIQQSNVKLEKISNDLRITNKLLEENVGEINEQKQIIEKKNSQIVESINYSLRIQEALLFNEKKLNHFFKDSFIISKAKDIVTGDFFLVTKKRNKLYVSVADCTGHGVPGALLSILGYEEINHLIEYNNFSPAQILEELNKKINKLLNSEKQLGSDGMDIMLLEIDILNKTLTYSGARSYLLLYDNNSLKEYKGDRISIGEMTDSEVNYNNYQVDISDETKIFLYTDGFQDQQSEKASKRIGSKAFKQSIMQTIDKTFIEQKDYLLNYFEEQKGKVKQTDDITILGFSPSFAFKNEDVKTENPKLRELLSYITNNDFEITNLIVLNGQMNQETVVSAIQLVERNLNTRNYKKGFVNRMKVICIEILQNIIKHQCVYSNYLPYFILNESNRQLNFYAGNVITIEEKEFLSSRLKFYKEINFDKLKEIYIEKYSNTILTNEGNAGLGLLTIAIKSKQNIKYDFVKINERFYHFNIELLIDFELKP